MTMEEMRTELYERARAFVAAAQPGYEPEVIAKYAYHGVDAMINAQITAGVDEAVALENALKQDIKKIITVIIAR